jgi:hypothetical protein
MSQQPSQTNPAPERPSKEALKASIDRHVARSAETVACIPPQLRTILSKTEENRLMKVQDMDEHPLIRLLLSHYQDSVYWKEVRADLSPAGFNREFGLTIQGPSEWPYHEAIKIVADEAIANKATSVVVIYGSTAQYDAISKVIDSESLVSRVSYLSWQEIYSAMQLVNNDARLIQIVRNRLAEANLVFFVGAPLGVSEVIDQVRAFCDGCLIIFG